MLWKKKVKMFKEGEKWVNHGLFICFKQKQGEFRPKRAQMPRKTKGGKKDKINKTDIKPIKCLTTDSSEFVATAGAANAHSDFIGAFNTVSHDILRNKHRMD